MSSSRRGPPVTLSPPPTLNFIISFTLPPSTLLDLSSSSSWSSPTVSQSRSILRFDPACGLLVLPRISSSLDVVNLWRWIRGFSKSPALDSSRGSPHKDDPRLLPWELVLLTLTIRAVSMPGLPLLMASWRLTCIFRAFHQASAPSALSRRVDNPSTTLSHPKNPPSEPNKVASLYNTILASDIYAAPRSDLIRLLLFQSLVTQVSRS